MTFSFHRGSLALDFVGTVGRRASANPEERLLDRTALGSWLVEAGLLQSCRPSLGDFARAIALREAIYSLAKSALAGAPLAAKALAVVNGAAQGLRLGAPRLTASSAVRWNSRSPVRLALARVAADAIERIAHNRERLMSCQLEGCGALLLSYSRSNVRRWCSMETCGNLAKAAAHRERERRRALSVAGRQDPRDSVRAGPVG